MSIQLLTALGHIDILEKPGKLDVSYYSFESRTILDFRSINPPNFQIDHLIVERNFNEIFISRLNLTLQASLRIQKHISIRGQKERNSLRVGEGFRLFSVVGPR